MRRVTVPAKDEARAVHRSRMGVFVPIGCDCGAQLRYEETLTPGAVIGGADTIREAWKRHHSGEGCRFVEGEC